MLFGHWFPPHVPRLVVKILIARYTACTRVHAFIGPALLLKSIKNDMVEQLVGTCRCAVVIFPRNKETS